MDNQRVFVWAALALVLFLNYQAWQKDYAPQPAPQTQTTTQQTQKSAPTGSDMLPPLPSATSTPATPANGTTATPAATPAATTAVESASSPANAAIIHVVTDVLDMDISTRGGDLVRADLPKYPKVKNQPEPVRLLNGGTPVLFVVHSGLRASDPASEPNHLATFKAAATEYKLNSGDAELRVPLTWTDSNGVTVTKTYVLKPGSYRIDLEYQVANQSANEWKAASYVQIVRHYEHVERSYFNVETYAYRGPAIFDGKAYRRLNVEDKEESHYTGTITGGWAAAMQHHFVVAAVPPDNVPYDFQLGVNASNDYTLSQRGPLVAVPAGGTSKFDEKIFVGPKLQDQLDETGTKLHLVADYGKYFTIIARPLFLVLSWVHDFVGNWGIAIILVTFLIKLAFYRLTAASGRSMAKMRNIAPRIKAIQERYKDDREQLGRQMMDIYKREKVNPLAGCLPMLIQIPFFMSFYWVLLESVEMRQAPFFAWITDLSSRDPFFILPVLMGGAMFAQFKLQPMPSTDPIQAKIFMFMPIVMAGTMMFFPSGLVIYWLTNTLLSIAQQTRINKLVTMEAAAKKT
jgi:YidC/Oxa1 family membrane protein insertase